MSIDTNPTKRGGAAKKQHDNPDGEDAGRDDEVGYRNPPKHTRFEKGTSGNPKGRPKGSRNFSTDVKDTLKQPVRLSKDGKRETISTQQAALERLREKALKGDNRALDKFIDLARTYNDEEMPGALATLEKTDGEIMADYDRRVLQRAVETQTDEQTVAETSSQPDDGVSTMNDAPDEEDNDDWLK
jgi:hypothetical protein